MANIFTSLPVPSANGAGAAVNMTAFGALKTCIVSRGSANPDISITIEFSNDAGGLFWAPLVTEQGSGTLVTEVACRWMRARVSNFKQGNPDDVQVGGADDGTILANVVVPPADGVGAVTNIAALGLFKTVQIGDTFRGNVLLELSEDNVTWAEFASFSAPGFNTALAIAQFARVRRNGVPVIAPGQPVCNIGATLPPGGSPSVGLQAFRYTVTGLEADTSDFMVPLPVARASDIYRVAATLAGVTLIVGYDAPDVIAGDRTVAAFRFVTTAPMTAGDQIDFVVMDPVP